MSTHKTTADQDLVISFLKETFSPDISNFEHIEGGEGSQAYSFDSNGKEYIMRVNKHHTLGFKKDEYAFKNFSSPAVPIPEVLKVGKINSGLRFCVSERVPGKILTAFSSEELVALLPKMFEVLDAIHATDVNGATGFGKWDAEGKGEHGSWREFLLTVDKYAKGEAGSPSLFDTTFLERDFWDKVYTRLVELILLCPEERFLVHGDYGFNNALSNGVNITGIIDWETSMYGDFLYDVAWLSFWSRSLDYEKLYLDHSTKKGVAIENFAERMLCYKIFIGLGSLSFYAYSGQKDKYGFSKAALEKLLS